MQNLNLANPHLWKIWHRLQLFQRQQNLPLGKSYLDPHQPSQIFLENEKSEAHEKKSKLEK